MAAIASPNGSRVEIHLALGPDVTHQVRAEALAINNSALRPSLTAPIQRLRIDHDLGAPDRMAVSRRTDAEIGGGSFWRWPEVPARCRRPEEGVRHHGLAGSDPSPAQLSGCEQLSCADFKRAQLTAPGAAGCAELGGRQAEDPDGGEDGHREWHSPLGHRGLLFWR